MVYIDDKDELDKLMSGLSMTGRRIVQKHLDLLEQERIQHEHIAREYEADNLSDDELLHYGMPKRSGRYPWGSGETWKTKSKSDQQKITAFAMDDGSTFRAYRNWMKNENGMSDEDIRGVLGLSTGAYRDMVTLANEDRKRDMWQQTRSMAGDGKSVNEIMETTGLSRTAVHKYLKMDESTMNLKKQSEEIADVLKGKVDEVKYLDISEGVERQLGVSQEKLRTTVSNLTASGEYDVKLIQVDQVTNPGSGIKTTVKVLVPKGVDTKEIYANLEKVRPVDFYMEDGDVRNLQNIQVPKSIGLDRVTIKYAIPEGQKGHGSTDDGATMDGAMFIRPGVPDLNMGKARYAQVRIAVGDKNYLKGMALYGDEKDFPPGVDIIFNTNKTKDVPKTEVLKKLEGPLDGPNPFKATISRQAVLLDKNGKPVVNKALTELKEKRTGKKGEPVWENGTINIVNEEGDWSNWSKGLSAQFLSKQPPSVVKDRLTATLKSVDKDYQEIMKIDNPVIKQELLKSYSSSLEAKQIHLKAIAPKGFQGHVLLPVPKMKENEVYAPKYNDGEKVILIRYPHAGRFEIPELTVNNSGPGKKMIGGQSRDAIGIHPKTATQLSGADFDGDVAYVIPNNSRKFKAQKPLPGLKGFEPSQYKDTPGTFTVPTGKYKNKQMGIISNLITDMTFQGASPQELERAVRHSMVVIDSEKHKLNLARSAKDNGIAALQKKYMLHRDNVDYSKLQYVDQQGRTHKIVDSNALANTNKEGKGASTIISRRKQKVPIGGEEVEIVDPKTGKKRTVLRGAREMYTTALLKDASIYLNKNSSQIEKDYVGYVNDLKTRKNAVDKELATIKTPSWDRDAERRYKPEVESLKKKLNESLLNAPRERQAQLLATYKVNEEIKNRGGREEIEKDELKKIRNQALNTARLQVGAKRNPVVIDDNEWEAIQSNAISATMLRKLTRHMDDSQLKQLATPRKTTKLSVATESKIMVLLNRGYSIAQVAEAMNLSPSTISRVKAEA